MHVFPFQCGKRDVELFRLARLHWHEVHSGFLAGSDALALHDPSGRPIVQDMIAALAKGDQAEVDYSWPNPVTGAVENKHTYLRKIGNLLVGVGYYWR